MPHTHTLALQLRGLCHSNLIEWQWSAGLLIHKLRSQIQLPRWGSHGDYTLCLKNKHNYFCYDCVKLPQNLIIFGTKMANTKIIWCALIFHLNYNLRQCIAGVVKYWGSDRWWQWRHLLWWGDACKMRWTRRTVNRMRLTEWRRELIPQVRWCICERTVGDL